MTTNKKKKTELTLFEAWDDSCSSTFTFADNIADMKRRGLIEKDAKLVFSIKAKSWVDAMGAYHKFRGWGKYVPMDP